MAIALIAGHPSRSTNSLVNVSTDRAVERMTAAASQLCLRDPSPANFGDGAKSTCSCSPSGVDAAIQSLPCAATRHAAMVSTSDRPDFSSVLVGSGVPTNAGGHCDCPPAPAGTSLRSDKPEDRHDVRQGVDGSATGTCTLEITVGATNRILDDFPNIRPLTSDSSSG